MYVYTSGTMVHPFYIITGIPAHNYANHVKLLLDDYIIMRVYVNCYMRLLRQLEKAFLRVGVLFHILNTKLYQQHMHV